MNFYDEYKPFRNLVRRFDLLQGLVDIWAYSRHVMGNHPLPAGYLSDRPRHVFTPVRDMLYPWDLDTLSREFVLNGGRGGECRLTRWRDLAQMINHVRHLDEETYLTGDGGSSRKAKLA